MAKPRPHASRFLALAAVLLVHQFLMVTAASPLAQEGGGGGGGGSGLASDRASLLEFKSGIAGDPLGALADWNSPAVHVCNWTGIRCNFSEPPRVVMLDLSGRSLSGTISPALSRLAFLAVLDLSRNSFSGSVPAELGQLAMLKELSLSFNLLEGHVPTRLGSLSRLIYLDLGSNRLGGVVPRSLFCNCSSLQYLDLSNNTLTGIIHLDNECQQPSELEYLLLWSNSLVGPVPLALSNFSSLKWVDFEANRLTGELPSTVFDNLPFLQILSLSYNNLSSSDHNTDLGPFFASLANCTHLVELKLAGNGLGGVIPSHVIGNLSTELVELHLEENQIRGPIPPNISNLLNLTYLNLSNNLLNGSIPPDIAQLRRLERVYLFNNMLSGGIPPEIGSIPRLGLLDISSNFLSGPIPHTLSNLSQLRWLLLQKNNLSGPIPSSLGSCSNLEILDLSHNKLTGTVPTEVAGLSNLKIYMNLSSNCLEGQLPLELSKMDMLIALDLSSNNFSGSIPSQLGSCVALEYLNLSNNGLQGPLPSHVGNLPYLKVLDLSSNELVGSIPKSVQASSSLKQLNVSFNHFSGPVPSDGRLFSSLSVSSFLGNPDLCGQVTGMQPCHAKRSSQKFRRSIFLPLLMILIGVSSLSCILVFSILLRSNPRWSTALSFRREPPDDEEHARRRRDYPRISYSQLVEATGGFAGSNLIGSGSFGRVYKGVLRDQTRIAVKVLDPKCAGELSCTFKRECDVLKRTRHRNLIRIITTCSRPDFKALVLPLMSNGSLESCLSGRRIDLGQLVNVAGGIAEGMAYLHHYSPVRVIHCDLKPSNVLLDEHMNAVVSDFGIARLVRGAGNEAPETTSSGNSMAGLLCGSLGYIAPEYGVGGQPCTKGDVYSFGVLLLEMVTGKRPTDVVFQEGSTLQEWVKSHYPHNLEAIVQEELLIKTPTPLATNSTDYHHHTESCKRVVVELVELGLVCTQLSPAVRPTMADVAHDIGLLKGELARISLDADESSSLPGSSF